MNGCYDRAPDRYRNPFWRTDITQIRFRYPTNIDLKDKHCSSVDHGDTDHGEDGAVEASSPWKQAASKSSSTPTYGDHPKQRRRGFEMGKQRSTVNG